MRALNMERLRALHVMAHAESCTDGERANAYTLLNRLLKKYGITEADIKQSELHWLPFPAKDEYHVNLLGQLLVYIRQSGNETFAFKRYNGKVYIEATEGEQSELKRLLRIHGKALTKELSYALQAYIQRNKLYGQGEGKDIDDMSKAELADIAVVLNRARLMDATTVKESRTSRLLKGARDND